MTVLGTETVQQGLTFLGYEPGPIDGIYGPRTDDALERFVIAKEDETGYVGAQWSAAMGSKGRGVELTPDGFAFALKTAARSWADSVASRSTGSGTPRAAGPAAPEFDPPLAYLPSEPFWRLGNPLAWLLGLAGAAAVGGGGYYFMKGRRRRRR